MWIGSLLLVVLLGGCVNAEPRQLVPSITLSPETLALSDPAGTAAGVDLGLEAAVNESDSLFNVATLPGVRVRSVVAGGPAEQAGLRAGDVILSVDGTPTDHPDALAALAADVESTIPLVLQLRRDTAVLEAHLVPRLRGTAAGDLRELYRVDPVASRTGYRSTVLERPGQTALIGARIVAFYPDSPLPAAGLREGDLILALDGQPVASAQGLVNQLNQNFVPGRRVLFTLLRDTDTLELPVRLWDPGRHLTRLSLGPLLHYEADPQLARTRFALLDLWLFAVYRFTRDGNERQHSLLGLFTISSELGALQEATP
jgi:membrane-associated protease RseP (regulator of RpoE activity)